MKTITISTENSETYSSISNFFIDYYMTDANGEFVKVYLYLIRLLNSKQQISVAEIADHFNLTEKDICRAIKYWVTKDALRLTFAKDYTVKVVYKGQEMGTFKWSLVYGLCNVESENPSVYVATNEDGSLNVDYSDDEDFLTFKCVKDYAK